MKTVKSMVELAEIAGCSVMTVSYALRDSPKISRETRQRIQELALKHGYRKHPYISALMATRQKKGKLGGEVIAVLTKEDQAISSSEVRLPFYSDLYDGMKERAAELGYQLEEFATASENALDGPRLTSVLHSRGIRGVVLMPGGSLKRSFPKIDPTHFSLTAAGFHAQDLAIHRTATDYGAGFRLCLEEMKRRGYRRIGFPINKKLDPQLRYSVSGRFLAWQTGIPRKDRIPFIRDDSVTTEKGPFLEWFHKYKPDCILAPRISILYWLREEGLRIPEDVGCCFIPTRDNAELSGFDTHSWQVGRTTVNLLTRELLLNHQGLPDTPEILLVSGRWQEGQTLRPVPTN
ncbi:LacI family DNA-binding transcriptional regulator [Puniceicoccus vermicola]|uniref:LacI family DNA-binding transcriptional regulator n=1 Tax=Puniceicoccus vermicola TaxID=388746 RepID=A0A7X1AUS8_9BACT|nr:LacI family DNA-binding transcriptional regulator [Puniceicoccus vermicola]MBC2600197.1 LacI family DNA-binding transcriptional regulator [Puniceicoccus vermicola]